MAEHSDSDLIETLSVLYELSLTIGRSLDFEEACAGFVIPLMSRKNLSHAVVWRRQADELVPVWALPSLRADFGMTDVANVAVTSHPCAFGPDDAAWSAIHHAYEIEDGEAALFPLPGIGVLTVRRGLNSRAFDYASLAQLQPLMEQFAISLQAADAYRRSQQERVELRKATEAADAANLAKSQFLSRVSHELRTPLNAVLGFTELAAMTEIGSETADWLDRVLVAGRHLLTLIDDVLDVSRVEAGELSLNVEPLSLCDLVHDALPMILGRADELDIEVHVEPPPLTPSVCVDPVRARQVIVNLLSNAVKFNRPGGAVILRCQATDVDAAVSVIDTGLGIAEGDLDRLFVPFDRLGQEAGGVDGTGIGLSLSQALANAMGGSLTADSALGVGSTFVFRMPLAFEDAEVRPIGTVGAIAATTDHELREAA